MSIPITQFVSNPWNFNRMMDDELESLAADIRSGAIIDKIVVRKKGDKYEIIDGEQRIKALKLLGRQDVALELVDIRDFNDAQVRAYVRSSLTRGSHKDLVREAEVYLEDFKASGLDMKAYAEKIGMEYTKLSRLLKRNNMPLPAKAFIQRTTISPYVLDAVLMARPDYVFPFLQRAVEEKWSVEDAELAIKSGVGVDGQPVKSNMDRAPKSDMNKFDMVERAAMSNVFVSFTTNLARVLDLCNSKGANICMSDTQHLLDVVNKLKNKVDGQRVVYPKAQGEQIRRVNDVSEWLASGTDDERKDKVERVNAKIKELID